MSSDPIPFPTSPRDCLSQELRDKLPVPCPYPLGSPTDPEDAIALDPMKFEQEVLAASKARPMPQIRSQLLMFVQRHAPGTSVVRGDVDGYNWQTGVLTLARETAKGEGMRALLTVAHECAHANQRRDWPWLPAWALKVPIVRLFLETNAWRRALRMLT